MASAWTWEIWAASLMKIRVWLKSRLKTYYFRVCGLVGYVWLKLFADMRVVHRVRRGPRNLHYCTVSTVVYDPLSEVSWRFGIWEEVRGDKGRCEIVRQYTLIMQPPLPGAYGKPNCHLPSLFHLISSLFHLNFSEIEFHLSEIDATKITFH